MLQETLWTRFQDSGSISDYLAFAAIKGMEHADDQRHRPDAEDAR